MGQNVANVNLRPIVVNGCDQSALVSADVENREFPNLVGMRENAPHLGDVGKLPALDFAIPMDECGPRIRVTVGEFMQSLAGDDVHCAILSRGGSHGNHVPGLGGLDAEKAFGVGGSDKFPVVSE